MRKKQWLEWICFCIVLVIIIVPSHIIMNKFVFHYDFKTITVFIIKNLFIVIVLSMVVRKICKLNDEKFNL